MEDKKIIFINDAKDVDVESIMKETYKNMEEQIIIYATDSDADITFIMEEIYKNGVFISAEVKGFYYGEPNEEATKEFYGKLKAEFEFKITLDDLYL